MKNIKYILLTIIAIATTISCVKDELQDSLPPLVEGGEVKLNEIMSTGDPDWLELYNTTDADIDITGYALGDSGSVWTIPNMTIPANGHVAFDCDGLDTNGSTNFKISSGGENIKLFNAAEELIDEIETPDMSAQEGLTYGREVDGEDVWTIMSPTKGAANSNENSAPIIIAEPLTEFMDVYSVQVSDADGLASVKLVQMINEGVQSIDMALVDGEYKTSVTRANVGETVLYYVVATDTTGLVSYYPENGNNEPAEFTVAGGLVELVFAGTSDGNIGDVTFYATPHYPNQVDEIKLYYLLPGEFQDDNNDDKHNVVLEQNGDVWEGVIPAQNTDDVVRYYVRVEYIDGTKTYYPEEEDGGEFNHDYGTTWPFYTVEAIVYDDVIETTYTFTEGPLVSVTFPTNPIPNSDINIVLTYETTDVIDDARIYFDVGETPIYDSDNKVKGADDSSFTQTGVTINLKDVVAVNGLIVSDTGNKTTFFVRIQTEDTVGNALAEYYYGSDGSMYLDDTPGGGTTDDSDFFKADPSLWDVLDVQ
mgnify:CR=1 FL=1